MAKNRWQGTAQSQAERRILIPRNIYPGSVWQLRVGANTWSYTYPDTIEVAGITEAERAKAVVDGLLEQYDGGGAQLGGGGDGTTMTLAADLWDGQWALVANGPRSGEPLDVTLTGNDPDAARITVTELQKGNAAQNEFQLVRWPQTPTGGTAFWRFRDNVATLAYNASAATVKSGLEALARIGSGNVDVTGNYIDGYTVEFKGVFAGKDVDTLYVYSQDATGIAAYAIEITQSPVTQRQTHVIARLSGDTTHLYRFKLRGEYSHYFTGADNVDALRAALEAIPGVGPNNISVVAQADGTTLVTMIGVFIDLDTSDLTIEPEGDAPDVGIESSAPDASVETTRQRITFHNRPVNGTFKLTSNGNETAGIPIFSNALTITTAMNAATGFAFWQCTSSSGGISEAWVLEMEFLASFPSVLLVDVTGLLGTRAIDVSVVKRSLPARNEIQQVAVATDPVGGTFELSFNGNTATGIAYNASAATIKSALEALASVGSGNLKVAGPVGGPWIIEFVGTKAAANQPAIGGNGNDLTLGNTATADERIAVAPTGPNWYNNPKNWSLGHVPIDDEIAVFENGSVPCTYGLEDIPAFAGMDIYRSYSGRIGLPSARDEGSPETLPMYLKLTDNTATFILRVGLGDEGPGPSLVRVDSQDQDVKATVFYMQAAGASELPCQLIGTFSEISVGDASVGIATKSGETATVDVLRIRPASQEQPTVEWGEQAVVGKVNLTRGLLRAGSVPAELFIDEGICTVKGDGDCDVLQVRLCQLRWIASGKIGRQGTVSAISLDGSNRAVLTSAGHGLTSGARVFVSGFVGVTGLPDAFYTVSVVDANNFALVGTSPGIPYGASTPSTVPSYYQANTASWGQADAVVLGEDGILDLSAMPVLRSIIAPVVLQSLTSRVIDPLVTVKNLRQRYNPGSAEAVMGIGCVLRRDERAAATATPGNLSGAGGLAVQ